MTLGIAILGAGIFAREAHLPAIKALGNAVELKAIYSRSEKSAQALADSAKDSLSLNEIAVYHDGGAADVGLDALFKRVDVNFVIVALPINTQPDVIIKALAAGKHVLSEKPVHKDVASAAALVEKYNSTYKSTGVHWRVAENFEVEPGLLAARKAIDDGAIGDVLHFNLSAVARTDSESKWYKTPWRTIPDYQGGFLLDGGVHSAAQVRVVIPSPISQLSAIASLSKAHLAPEDTIHAIVQTEGPTHGIFELSFAAPSGTRSASNGMIVTGSHGWLDIRTIQKEGVGWYKVTVHKGEGEETVKVIEERSQGVERELDWFVQLVSGGKDAGYGLPEGALRDVAFIEAALKSKGKPIELGV